MQSREGYFHSLNLYFVIWKIRGWARGSSSFLFLHTAGFHPSMLRSIQKRPHFPVKGHSPPFRMEVAQMGRMCIVQGCMMQILLKMTPLWDQNNPLEMPFKPHCQTMRKFVSTFVFPVWVSLLSILFSHTNTHAHSLVLWALELHV